MKRQKRILRSAKWHGYVVTGMLFLFLGAGLVGIAGLQNQKKWENLLEQKEQQISAYCTELTNIYSEREQRREEDVLNGREVWIEDVTVGDFIGIGERVDIRIGYANAEDYIVLSNKTIKLRDKNYGIVLLMTEEEILMLSSALTDVGRFPKTSLYAVRYPEQLEEDKSRVNYLPNEEVAKLLGINSNSVELRRALEKRLLAAEEW